MNFDQLLWGNKKFSDLLKDIYSNSKEKEKQIKDLIETLKPFVSDSQSAIMVVPLVAEYLNISIKNDEQLVKLASIIQRSIANSNGDSSEYMLSEIEREQLFNDVKKIGSDIKEPKVTENV